MTARELKSLLAAVPDDAIIATGPQLRVVRHTATTAGTMIVDQSGNEEVWRGERRAAAGPYPVEVRNVTILEVM